MKNTIFLAMALLPLLAAAQKPFKLNGEVKNLKNSDKLYLVYRADGKNVTDSANATDGAFLFTGVISEPVKASLYLNKNPKATRLKKNEVLDETTLYLEPGVVKLLSKDSLKYAVIEGSVINDDAKKLDALTQEVTAKIHAIYLTYEKSTTGQQKVDPSAKASFEEQYEKESAKLTTLYSNFAEQNPRSYMSLVAVSYLYKEEDLLGAERIFNNLSPELKQMKMGKEVGQRIETAKKTAVGQQAMDFTQNDTEGKPVKLSDFKGKYVLLDFWASWCGPCRRENPNVVSAYNSFKDKGFTVLGVSLDQPGKKEAWLKAIVDDQLNWTQVSDLKFWNNEVARMYGIRGIPANFLIDDTGKIIAKNLRGEHLSAKLEELFGKKTK